MTLESKPHTIKKVTELYFENCEIESDAAKGYLTTRLSQILHSSPIQITISDNTGCSLLLYMYVDKEFRDDLSYLYAIKFLDNNLREIVECFRKTPSSDTTQSLLDRMSDAYNRALSEAKVLDVYGAPTAEDIIVGYYTHLENTKQPIEKSLLISTFAGQCAPAVQRECGFTNDTEAAAYIIKVTKEKWYNDWLSSVYLRKSHSHTKVPSNIKWSCIHIDGDWQLRMSEDRKFYQVYNDLADEELTIFSIDSLFSGETVRQRFDMLVEEAMREL